MRNSLQVGFGRADISPAPGVQLGGYGNDDKRPTKQVLDPLYATCLAFTDGEGSTALVYTVDMLYSPGWARPAVAQALGLPVEKIHFSATHSHSAPVRALGNALPGSSDDMPAVRAYYESTLKPALIAAGKEALADRRSAKMFTAEARPYHMNFVRRYRMTDGSYAGPNFGDFNKTIECHESQVDDQMQLVKFEREGGKDILLCNFQTHQTMTGGMLKYDASADIAGAMRASLEGRTELLLAYYTGGCGNVVPGSKIEQEKRFSNEQYKEYGAALADYAIQALNKLKPLAAGKVQTAHMHKEGDVNHSLDYLADKMLPIVEIWEQTGDRPRCNELARAIGLNSVYNAQSALGKMKLGKTLGIDLDVVSVGELAFVMAPYEMFDANGMEIKSGSPFPVTVVATCANDTLSYIPSKLAYEHGGYEIDRSQFVPGFGEEMARSYVSMLDELKKNEEG